MAQMVKGKGEDTVASIAPYLSHQNEVIRCSAIRAYAAWAPPERTREALLEKLLDSDPDIRADVIERLVGLATAKDAAALRNSLEGDPVSEAKMAAIEALSAIRDESSIPVLRRLVHSRSEDSVAWEDDVGDWDEWLDIQLAAIKALGHLQVADAIEDLLTARQDEFGQNIDGVVFDALCEMGGSGIETLVQITTTEDARAARRATAVLSKADPRALAPYANQLLASEDAETRITALGTLASGDPRAVALAHHDPSPEVQCAALRHIALDQPSEVEAALHSRHEVVQSEALALLDRTGTPEFHDALVDNLISWLLHAGPRLATAAACALPRFAPNRCEAPLIDTIANADAHLETRIASVAALADKSLPAATEVFGSMIENPARQIRTAAFAEIARRAKDAEQTALDTVVAAIRGELVSANPDMAHRDEADIHDAAMPKSEAGPQSIRITRDGEIVEGEDASTGSTLHEILAASREPDEEPEAAEDTPEEAPAKRRKRQPVQGPADFAASFQIDAIGICNDTGDERVEAALLHCAVDGSDQIRRAAWQALAKWPENYRYSASVREAALGTMKTPDPIVRSAAFSILARRDLPPKALELGLESEDALLRAEAVAHLPASSAADFITDPSAAVRRRSLEQLLKNGEQKLQAAAAQRLFKTEWTDTLAAFFARSRVARAEGQRHLSQSSEPKQVLVLLEGFAGSGAV